MGTGKERIEITYEAGGRIHTLAIERDEPSSANKDADKLNIHRAVRMLLPFNAIPKHRRVVAVPDVSDESLNY